jgi:hypothetical protein
VKLIISAGDSQSCQRLVLFHRFADEVEVRIMAAWRRAIGLAIESDDFAKLTSVARSRTEPASRVERARMLLAYQESASFFAVGQALGVHHQTVQRCVERALVYGPIEALEDRPRPGKEPSITAEAKAWLVALACQKPKEPVS